MRGIAAMLVVFFHFTMDTAEGSFRFSLGVTGVDLFFIISGFVILMTIRKANRWQDFAVSRISRIYPTYWTCVTLTAIFCLLTQHLGLKWFLARYVCNMTMFQSYFNMTDIDGPYWTMIVEMLFYIFMLAVFLFKKLNRIELICSVLLIPVIVYAKWLPGFSPSLTQILGTRLPLINHFPLFFAGILFYQIKFHKAHWGRYLMLGVCFGVSLLLFRSGGKSNGFVSLNQYVSMLSAYFILFLLYVHGLLGFIVNRVTLWLGSVSFSLYLIHQYLGLYILIPFAKDRLNLNQLCSSFLVALPVVLFLAWAIHRLVEKPAMDWIRTWYKRKKVVE
jgi:peptidoglycan/LPS O-acetylase OafA/YrhL